MAMMRVPQFLRERPEFTSGQVRWWIFHAASNGMESTGVVIRIGRAVYIDTDAFDRWVAAMNPASAAAVSRPKAAAPKPQTQSCLSVPSPRMEDLEAVQARILSAISWLRENDTARALDEMRGASASVSAAIVNSRQALAR